MTAAGRQPTTPPGGASGEPGSPASFGRRGWAITAVLLAVAVLADLVVGRDQPGFDAVYGFAGCVAIIVVSKWLGKRWLQRTERYYEGSADA